jgi:hypothetical protein
VSTVCGVRWCSAGGGETKREYLDADREAAWRICRLGEKVRTGSRIIFISVRLQDKKLQVCLD